MLFTGACVGVAVGSTVGAFVCCFSYFFLRTITVAMYFFLPAFACTFAFPTFLAFTITLSFSFLLRDTFFFPDITVHFVFFLLFLSLILTVLPTYTLTNFFSNLTFFFAALLCHSPEEKTLQIVKQTARQTANILFNFLSIFIPPFLFLDFYFLCTTPFSIPFLI